MDLDVWQYHIAGFVRVEHELLSGCPRVSGHDHIWQWPFCHGPTRGQDHVRLPDADLTTVDRETDWGVSVIHDRSLKPPSAA